MIRFTFSIPWGGIRLAMLFPAMLFLWGGTLFAQTDSCTASAGTLAMARLCIDGTDNVLQATPAGDAVVPLGYRVAYVLTTGDDLVIRQVNSAPEFAIDSLAGRYTIHTLVFDPATLDLSVVQPGVTTGAEVAALLVQGGGGICGSLDVAGAAFRFACAPTCVADAGALTPESAVCGVGETTLTAAVDTNPVVPLGYSLLYVLTATDSLVIQAVSDTPEFVVDTTGRFTIHTLVYDSTTLDLSIVQAGVTKGGDVAALLIQGGGDICGALDVAGAAFDVEECICGATAGTLTPAGDPCLADSTVTLTAEEGDAPTVPNGFSVLYVLTTTDSLVILAVNTSPEFTVDTTGRYTIHTLVYDSTTLDLSIVQPGVTKGGDVNALLIQGGGDICGALDVAGAAFNVEVCPDCEAAAGTLTPTGQPCLADSTVILTADVDQAPTVPDGYSVLYVLTTTDSLVILAVNTTPAFSVDTTGRFTIHTLVYDSTTLDLSIVQPGVTKGGDVNALLIQGGGDICGALDVAGAGFNVEVCPECDAAAGTLIPDDQPCLADSTVTLSATAGDAPNVPDSFSILYVLTATDSLVIQAVSDTAVFTVDTTGRFTIHTLVYDSTTLDLSVVQPGVTKGGDVAALLIQGGGDICGALDVAGAVFNVTICSDCAATAGSLNRVGNPCLQDSSATLRAEVDEAPTVPDGFEVLYVLTAGTNLVIQTTSTTPEFTVEGTGRYTIHTLVYDPATLDLGIVQPGVTTGGDVAALLIQGGGDICGALDVAGAVFNVDTCPPAGECDVDVKKLMPLPEPTGAHPVPYTVDLCLDNQPFVELKARQVGIPVMPAGYKLVYVLTKGSGLIIQQVADLAVFKVNSVGSYRIHTLIYDPAALDLSSVQPGVTPAADVLGLLTQGGGDVCGGLDVEGAQFNVKVCSDCEADAGRVTPRYEACLTDGEARLETVFERRPFVPIGYQLLYVLTAGENLVIQEVAKHPVFTVNREGRFTMHTLVYDPATLDLSIVQPGVTTGADINRLLVQGGGGICASLDVAGAVFNVKRCFHRFRCYPNPSTNTITVELAPEQGRGASIALSDNYSLEVINARGEVVLRRALTSGALRQQIDLSGLTAGLYSVRILHAGDLVQVLRITKMD